MNKKMRITLAVIVTLLIAAVSAYFFVWRSSDNDYQAAAALTSYTEKTHRVVTVELSTIKNPNQINFTTPIKIQVLSKAYKNAVDALGQNVAINRDFAVQSVYNKHKNTLVEHAQSINNLANAFKLYVTVQNKCKLFTDSVTNKKSDGREKLLNECQSAISNGNTANHKAFNDQFFMEYLNQTNKYVQAMNQVASATNDSDLSDARQSADTINQSFAKLGEVSLTFESPNIIAITQELNTVIESQKKALLR